MSQKHLSDRDPDGTIFGQDPEDKISFYGQAPAPRVAGGATVPDDAAIDTEAFGFSEAQANAIVATLNKHHAALVALGLITDETEPE